MQVTLRPDGKKKACMCSIPSYSSPSGLEHVCQFCTCIAGRTWLHKLFYSPCQVRSQLWELNAHTEICWFIKCLEYFWPTLCARACTELGGRWQRQEWLCKINTSYKNWKQGTKQGILVCSKLLKSDLHTFLKEFCVHIKDPITYCLKPPVLLPQ